MLALFLGQFSTTALLVSAGELDGDCGLDLRFLFWPNFWWFYLKYPLQMLIPGLGTHCFRLCLSIP